MKLNRFLAILAAVLLVGIPAFAQTTASLTGTVTLGGNPLPGATVTISSPNLQGTRIAVSDANGNYNFGGIPPGDYTVKFEMESMQAVTKTVRVGLATTARADADMKLSAVAEAITVTASSPAVLETTEVQTNITQKLINDLPIGRDLRATVSLAPGVTSTGPGNNQVISGAPSFDNLYLVDGATVNENLRGQPHDLFIEDAIQETTILTGAISAEYGRFTGGVVTAVSKSGGNEFSGTFRDSFQSPAWTSNSERPVSATTGIQVTTDPKRANNKNQTYEGTLGGRIIRDRLWFFFAGRHIKRSTSLALFNSGPNFAQGRKQDRAELKLTGQITPKHSLTVSGLNIEDKQTNNTFPSAARTWEVSALDTSRETPNSFETAHYNGVITNSFLIEANAARKLFAFVGSGGDNIGDLANGTNVYDAGQSPSVYLGAPTFCGSCTNENRNNRNWNVKGTWYASTKSLGTHNLVAGYDNWHATRKSDNHQSASDWTVGLYEGPTGVTRDANGDALVTVHSGNAIMIWWPILESSKGTDLKTTSLFVNDKWDFNNKLSFNVGGRYDNNQGLDGSHKKVADDSKISPRLGAIYDVFANGRLRLNGSYSQYVAAIADGNVADAASPAGSPSYLYWLYYGPDIVGKRTPVALQTMFTWLQSVGFTNNKDFLLGGGSAGIQTQIPEALRSPYVGEWTIGAGSQIGSKGFVRVDYIARDWKNFYTGVTNLANGKAFDPLANADVDIAIVETTNDFKRTYKAVQLQASYAPLTRLNIGGNYTYSTTKGNHGAETQGSGPVANTGINSYPEYLGYANRNPVGYLTQDQTHKARAWASYDQPTPFGTFNFSVLQRFDSGTPYSAIGQIDPRRFFCDAAKVSAGACTAAQLGTRRTKPNPGYVLPPTTADYYFSKRGEFRTDDLTATDLAVNWNAPPVGKIQLYIETELRNMFNEQAVVTVNQSVNTNRNLGTLAAFDPMTDTPVEGVHWTKGPAFGKPTSTTNFDSAGGFQLPRTFLISAGLKF